MTDEEIQEMRQRFSKAQQERNEALRARKRKEAQQAVERFNGLSPVDQLLARCDATLTRLNSRFPAIDPEGDIDRPLQDEWKQADREMT